MTQARPYSLRVPWTARRSNQSVLKELEFRSQSTIFIGRTDTEAEAPILWPPDVKGWLIWKDPGAGKDWRQEENGTTEDEMGGWYHRLNGLEFEQALGVGDGQGSLVFCSPWCSTELDKTEWLGWTELLWWAAVLCCEMIYGEVHIVRIRGGLSANSSVGRKTSVQSLKRSESFQQYQEWA